MNAVFIFQNNAYVLTLASSFETNVVYIRKNSILVKFDLTLVSSLDTNAAFILENNVPEQPDLKLTSRLETNTVCILENNIPVLTLVSSLETISSLLSFPTIALSCNFHCIISIDFIYHSTLYHSHIS